MVKTSSTYIFRYFFCISGDFEGKMFGHPLDISTTVYGFGRRMEEEVGSMISGS